ncbi:hypothetical protein OIU74_014955 [Salix koriyanagi]|uniref:Uncharacterized protein n=1 Tax=Salix koriyanagi TaxID=2511006 RepID=A0A9Q0PX04_9ROSI|nr:hypothetical protein OIU74_014955 [Salix koriyanagi]
MSEHGPRKFFLRFSLSIHAYTHKHISALFLLYLFGRLQALDVIPRNPSRSPVPKRLGFSSTFNRTSYLSNPASSIRASISTSFSSNLDAIVKAFARQSFVTRARGVGVSRWGSCGRY